MRASLIVGLVALSISFGQPVAEQKGKPQKQQEASNPSPAPTAVPPFVTAQPSQPESKLENQHPPKETEKSYWKRAFAAETLSNWGLFFVGIGGILAALKTLGTIRRQADFMERQTLATEIAANAAKKSAEVAEMAMRLSERAVILLETAGLDTSPAITFGSRAYFEFKNFGRTVAKNTLLGVTLKVAGVEDATTKETPIMIGAEGSQKVWFPCFSEFIPKPVFAQMTEGVTTLTFHIKVTYDDVFGDSHEIEYRGTLDSSMGQFKITRQ